MHTFRLLSVLYFDPIDFAKPEQTKIAKQNGRGAESEPGANLHEFAGRLGE